MNDDGISWNRPLINSLFSSEIVRNIVSIPISNSQQEDYLFWKHTKDGNYSVKSGYWVAKRLKDASSSNPSSSSNNRDQWRWFWTLNIPPKLKLFTWRCMRGILQTKTNLIIRGISIDPVCSRCGNKAETLEHILRDCPWSAFYWKASTLRFSDNDLSPHSPLQDWILFHTKDKSNEFNEIFVALLWMNWKARNLLEFQHRDTSHMDCFNVVLSLLWEFQNVALQPRNTEAPQLDHHHWNPPQQGWIKFNSDASLGPLGVTGLGGIFRDCAGLPIRILSNSIPFCNDIELAEAMACLNGLVAAKEEGFRAVIFEMDNQTLYSKLRNGVIPRNQVGTVISNILYLAKDFECIVFQWARRSENRVAHNIANRARHPGLINHSDPSMHVNLECLIVADAAFCQSI